MKIDKLDCHTHITGLHYYDNKLFIGCGQDLEIYCLINKRQLLKHQVFNCININGIYHYKDDDQTFLIVYGNRFFKIYQLIEYVSNENQHQQSLEASSINTKLISILDQINLYDLILDIQFNENKKIYCLLTSNKLGCYDMKTNQMIKINCELKCTLYTSKFLNDFNVDYDKHQIDLNKLNNYQTASDQSSLTDQSNNQSIWIAGGTAFGTILICKYTNIDCQIINRLVGHDGAIFSLDYQKELNLLASASDDRTVRLWKFDFDKNFFQSLHVFYGHESRIWQVKLSKNCIVSCGENSNLFLWSYEGNCLFNEKSKKQSIWRLTLDEDNNQIFYGASDGSIKQRSIDNLIRSNFDFYLNVGPIKRLKFFQPNSNESALYLLVTNTDGKVKVVKIQSNSSNEKIDSNIVCEFDFGIDYASYNILDLEEKNYAGILGNIKGEIVKFKFKSNQNEIELISKQKSSNDKLLNVLTMQDELVVCSLNGKISIWSLDNLILKSKFNLSSIKEIHQLNCALRLNDSIIIFGDRLGNIFVYQSNKSNENIMKNSNQSVDQSCNLIEYSLIAKFKNLHGLNGIKFLIKHPFQNKFYSTGRDSAILEFSYSNNQFNNQSIVQMNYSIDLLRIIKIGLIDIEWIAKIEFDKSNGDLTYVCGFKSTLFIVWNNQTQSIEWTINSSGGSREWSLALTMNRMNFVCVKNEKLLFTSKLLNQSECTRYIRSKYHTNTIHCAQPLFHSFKSLAKEINKFYFITGSEDCDLFICALNRTNKITSIEAQLYGHISSVRACVVEDLNYDSIYDVNSSMNSNQIAHSLLISVGGSSQMMIWDIKLDSNEQLFIKQMVNYFIWNPDETSNRARAKKQHIDPQIRFMDVAMKRLANEKFLISTICSDGILRLFHLSLKQSYLYLLSTHALSNHCPLKMIIHRSSNLIASSTDGCLRFIELNLDECSKIDEQICEETKKTNFFLRPLSMIENRSEQNLIIKKECRLLKISKTIEQHQFGINSIDYIEIKKDNYLIFTCGEDTNLGYMMVEHVNEQIKENDKNNIDKNDKINDERNYDINQCSSISTQNNLSYNEENVHLKFKGIFPLKHSSMVSKVKILNKNLLMTFSWDKRIKIWSFDFDDDKLILNWERTLFSSIQNISEVIVDRYSSDKLHLIVLGEGREVYLIDLN